VDRLDRRQIVSGENEDLYSHNKFYLEKMLKFRTLSLFEAINAASARVVIDALLLLDAEDSTRPITLFLNSPGGEINSGFGIYDVIKFIRSEVKIVCTGLCASIATIILIAAKKENRLSLPNTRFLIHQPLISGTIRGSSSEIQIHAREIKKTRDRINSLLAQETGKNFEVMEKDTDRDFWMLSDEAIEYGLISKIISKHSEV